MRRQRARERQEARRRRESRYPIADIADIAEAAAALDAEPARAAAPVAPQMEAYASLVTTIGGAVMRSDASAIGEIRNEENGDGEE